MSFQSMAWATSQKLEHATDKYLLIMLANYANADGECYPSVERISEDTAMDRKTVMKCLSNLIELGLVVDTGKRVGSRGNTKVIRLNANYSTSTVFTKDTSQNWYSNLSGNQDTTPTELEDDPLISIFATPEEPPENNPKAFWDQAVGMLQALHVSPKTINPFIGRCLKMADQDQERVLDAIQAAVDAEPHDAVPYIVAILGGKKERKTARFEKTAKQKEIEDAFAKLEAASERRKAQWAADLGEDYTGTGGGEDLPIIQHQPPSEPVSISGKRSEGVRELPRRSPAQVSRPRKGYLNESEVSAHDF